MPWRPWRVHFEHNRLRPLPVITDAHGVPERLRAPLRESLRRFQRGEAGEGRIAREIDRARFHPVDADYRAALKQFVAEEGRHARVLADCVAALDGALLRATWTDHLFVRARRLFGIRFKLLVLLAAEVIGIGFYGLLAGGLGAGAIRDALVEIGADEQHHLRFHCAFFSAQASRPGQRLVFALCWYPVATVAALCVALDHRRTLAALGLPLSTVTARFAALIRQAGTLAATHVSTGAAVVPSTTGAPAGGS